jgi:hypothetical protein
LTVAWINRRQIALYTGVSPRKRPAVTAGSDQAA